MALRWLEGFETDFDSTDFGRKYGTATSAGWTSETGKKSVTGLLADAGDADELRTKPLVGAVSNTWFVGFRFRATVDADGIGNMRAGVTLFSGTGDQVEIRLKGLDTAAAAWEILRGATSLGTSTPSFFKDIDAYWEFKIVARTGANGSVEIRRDGVVVYTLSGINTANSGVDGADRVRFLFAAPAAQGATHWDDIYICDDTSALNNTYLGGDIVIQGTRPESDGNRVEWIPSTGVTHATLVDDLPDIGVAGDSDYVTTSVVGNDDLYNYLDLTLIGTSTPIIGLMVGTTGAMQATGTRDVKALFRDTGGGEANGALWTWNNTTITHQATCFDQNPVTTVPWTKTSINSGQFGITLFA